MYRYTFQQNSEIESLPFYEFEYLVENLKDHLEEQNKQSGNTEDYENYQNQALKQQRDMQKNMSKNQNIPTPKIPNMPNLR